MDNLCSYKYGQPWAYESLLLDEDLSAMMDLRLITGFKIPVKVGHFILQAAYHTRVSLYRNATKPSFFFWQFPDAICLVP